MVPAERTVTVGIGHGRKAALHIDAWLRGAQYTPLPKHELATFDKLNPWYYSDAPRPSARNSTPHDAGRRSMKSSADSMNPTLSSRRAGACRAATASRATTVTASAPTTRL